MNNESGVSSKIFEDTKSSLENVCRAICPPKNQDIDIASLLHEIGIYDKPKQKSNKQSSNFKRSFASSFVTKSLRA